MAETCAKCKLPVVCGHSLSLDGTRKLWRLCCLCTAALIEQLDDQKVTR